VTERHSAARVAIVTGASSGIGRATAERFGAAGYRVAAVYGADRVGGEAIAERIGGRAYGVDVADAEAVARVIETVEEELGPVSVAVSNAGFYDERPLAQVSDELWDRMLAVHLGGCLNLARSLAPRMRARGAGSIVAVASELALIGGVDVAPYVAAKAALLGLVRSLARELAPMIRVNAVAPGAVDTPLLPDRDRGPVYASTVPLGRIGRPPEVADAILHVAEAAWTTGAVYSPNGGVAIQGTG
jgi:NAD(P)-dependent dehydrogenase (short-subunit alcohol dehydrogenase family)